jgi:hypothetical protein
MFVAFAFIAPSSAVRFGEGLDLTQASREALDGRLEGAREGIAEIDLQLAELDMNAPGAAGARTGLEAGRAGIARGALAVEAEIARREGRPPPSGAEDLEDANVFFEQLVSAEDASEAGESDLGHKIREKLQNPDLLFYKLKQNAYKFSFLLVPISLPFVALLFLWKRGHTFYDHAVFTLYSLAFMSFLFIVVSLAGASAWSAPAQPFIAGIGAPVHMFFQLKGAYGLGWLSALWRTFFLWVFACVALVLFFALIFFMGVLG